MCPCTKAPSDGHFCLPIFLQAVRKRRPINLYAATLLAAWQCRSDSHIDKIFDNILDILKNWSDLFCLHIVASVFQWTTHARAAKISFGSKPTGLWWMSGQRSAGWLTGKMLPVDAKNFQNFCSNLDLISLIFYITILGINIQNKQNLLCL